MKPHPEPSDAELEEPGLSALYRQGATQTPPAELDRRILDQAQVALQSRPGSERSRWPRGWNRLSRWPLKRSAPWSWRRLAIPLSSAAAILLALGLVLRVLDEQGAMPDALEGMMSGTMRGAVPGAMRGAVQGMMTDAVRGTMRGAVQDVMPGVMPGAVEGLTDTARAPSAESQSSGPSESSQPARPSRPSRPSGLSAPSEPSGPSRPSALPGPSEPARPERGVAAKRASEEAIGSISKRALEEVKGVSAGAGPSMPPSPAPASAIEDRAPAQTQPPTQASTQASTQAKTPVQTPAQSRDQAEDQAKAHERRPALPISEGAGDVHLKSVISDERHQADPERWLEDIRQQCSSGERAEAIRQLAAFRQVHPDYPLPEDLRSLLGAE